MKAHIVAFCSLSAILGWYVCAFLFPELTLLGTVGAVFGLAVLALYMSILEAVR